MIPTVFHMNMIKPSAHVKLPYLNISYYIFIENSHVSALLSIAYMCVYVCMHVCMYVCIYIYNRDDKDEQKLRKSVIFNQNHRAFENNMNIKR